MKLSHQNNYVAVPTSKNDRFLGEPEQTDRQELMPSRHSDNYSDCLPLPLDMPYLCIDSPLIFLQVL